MLGLCHGSAVSGATHVPLALQHNISFMAVTQDATCATMLNGELSCWGNQATVPPTYCMNHGVQVQIATSQDNTMFGAVLCNDVSQSLYLWSNSTFISAGSVTSVSQLSGSNNGICYVKEQTGYCIGTSYSGSFLQTYEPNNTLLIFAGDDGGCVQTLDTSITCFGLYSQTVVDARTQTLLNAAISGGAMCFQWSDGWQCQTASGVMGKDEAIAVQSLITLWPLTYTGPTANPIPFYSLDVNAQWGSATGQLCVILSTNSQVWCQGTGFNDSPDIIDAIYVINTENTADAKQIVISPTHLCAAVSDPAQWWPWLVFLCIFIIVIFLFWVAWKYMRASEAIIQNPFNL